MPVDHRGFTINIAIEASLRDDQRWDGSWKRVGISTEDESTRDFGTGGKLTGVAKPGTTGPLPDPVTFECRMQGSLVGGDPTYGDRCMVLWLGLEDGRLVSTIQGRLNQKWTTYGLKAFTFAGNSAAADHDRLSARITVPTTTLDMEPCRYVFELEGRRLDEVLVGTYRLTVEVPGRADQQIAGSFDGSWSEGVMHLEHDDRPWFASVEGFQAPASGEHPRLLFRKRDLPALRERSRCPEGQAILKRLRYLLDGQDGQRMTTVFSSADKAYISGGHRNSSWIRLGCIRSVTRRGTGCCIS